MHAGQALPLRALPYDHDSCTDSFQLMAGLKDEYLLQEEIKDSSRAMQTVCLPLFRLTPLMSEDTECTSAHWLHGPSSCGTRTGHLCQPALVPHHNSSSAFPQTRVLSKLGGRIYGVSVLGPAVFLPASHPPRSTLPALPTQPRHWMVQFSCPCSAVQKRRHLVQQCPYPVTCVGMALCG